MKKINIVQSLKCRTLFVVGLLFLFTSCEPKFQEYQDIVEIKIDNRTDKIAVLEATLEIFQEEGHTYTLAATHINDKDSIVVKKTIKYGRDARYTIPSAQLYNITDTTSIRWDDLWHIYLYHKNLTATELIYEESWDIILNEKNVTTGDEYSTYILYPNERLFAIMQKDYSMLDKFPEYYLKP